MPRLLILCEYPTLWGGERSLLSTLSAVNDAGFEPCVAAPPSGPLADALRARDVPVFNWSDRAALAEIVKATRPDLVHANSLSAARLSGPVVAASGVPSIGHLRDIVRLSQQAVADLHCHRRLVAVSQATRHFHIAQGLDAEKCVVLHNGVDLIEFRPHAATGYIHRELRLPAGVPLVAVIGQIGLRKGLDVALEAARSVPGVHWLVVGERTSDKDESRTLERRLHELASEPPLVGRVHFLGRRNDIHLLLPECALLVHAARQEPLGRVLIEAAACSLAVVATDVGGTREIFPTTADGALLVPPDDPIALGTAAAALLADDVRRKSLGVAARRRAAAAFDVRVASQQLIDLYQSVLTL